MYVCMQIDMQYTLNSLQDFAKKLWRVLYIRIHNRDKEPYRLGIYIYLSGRYPREKKKLLGISRDGYKFDAVS